MPTTPRLLLCKCKEETMTNATRKRLNKLYSSAAKEQESHFAYSFYVNHIPRMGLTYIEYEEAVQKLAKVMKQ